MGDFQGQKDTASRRGGSAAPASLLLALLAAACGSDPLPAPGPAAAPRVRLAGTVHEAGNRSTPVVGAQVEIVGGSAARLATSTDWNGSYSLNDVPSDAAIRVSKHGYAPAVVSVRDRTILTPALSVLDVPLVWTGLPGRDVSGSYTLTLSANCSATSDLPAALRARQYTATVARLTETEVEVRLGGAAFDIEQGSGKGDRFFGRIVAEGVLFTLEAVYDWGPHPSVLEQLPDGWLEISGRVLAHHTETGLSGTLNGSFTYYPGANPSWYVYEWCPSESHLFVLSR